jgi:sulfur carrier protein ThiS
MSFRKSLDEGATIRDLLREIKVPEQFRVLAMVNGVMAGPDNALKDGDEITLFSPVGGG